METKIRYKPIRRGATYVIAAVVSEPLFWAGAHTNLVKIVKIKIRIEIAFW